MDSLITICTGNADTDYRVEMSGGAKNIFFQGQDRVRAYTHTHTHIYIYIYIYIYLSITSLHEECLRNQNIYIELVFTSLQKIKSKS